MNFHIYQNADCRKDWIGYVEWGDWLVFLPTDRSKPTVVPKPESAGSIGEEHGERVVIDADGSLRGINERSAPSAKEYKTGETDGQ